MSRLPSSPEVRRVLFSIQLFWSPALLCKLLRKVAGGAPERLPQAPGNADYTKIRPWRLSADFLKFQVFQRLT
ncbi:hypothetical protein CBM2587_A30021 [Cupriavidus taiwanensis]|uniref:Uncharacterized protein n=1 Tax=Cupriavidus taiwanensis TaxID=164546 RepID=A0A975X1S7_9BURK|nr:hypothetical protein CBM2587_A30021 [Cupriavidus taiwanensis]